MDLPFKLPPRHLWMEPGLRERGYVLEGAKSHATGLVADLGDPPTRHKMAGIDISQGSQGFGTGIVNDLGGTARGCIMGGSQMGLGSRALCPCPV